MKKIGTLLLTLSLVTIVGCGNNKSNNSIHHINNENISTNEVSKEKEVKSYQTIEPVLKSREDITRILGDNFTSFYDEVEDYTWFMPTQNIGVFKCSINPCMYFSDSDGDVGWIVFRYAGDQWVFFDSLIIKTDNNKYTKTFDYGEVKEDMDVGGVTETVEVPFDKEMYKTLEDIVHSDKAIIRFSGEHIYDYEVTQQDKQLIQAFLDCYTFE